MFRVQWIAVALVAFSMGGQLARGAESAAPVVKTPELKLAANEVAIYISDMHCATCAKKIAGRLYSVKGVVKVRTSVKENLAIITPQAKKQVDPKLTWAAVQKAGFKPVKMIAPQGTFVAQEKSKEPQKVAEVEATKRS